MKVSGGDLKRKIYSSLFTRKTYSFSESFKAHLNVTSVKLSYSSLPVLQQFFHHASLLIYSFDKYLLGTNCESGNISHTGN